ncbi:hypothetical protein HAX54_047971 [Datura stramonium]|uniref:Uncharacterized protein n=1 Tax=Datura stramonium TaxID=4076 RepID=A0ABS8WLN2_DATST|nr:hypothetical protein [Datura stramonium]
MEQWAKGKERGAGLVFHWLLMAEKERKRVTGDVSLEKMEDKMEGKRGTTGSVREKTCGRWEEQVADGRRERGTTAGAVSANKSQGSECNNELKNARAGNASNGLENASTGSKRR